MSPRRSRSGRPSSTTNAAGWELFCVEYINANLEYFPLFNDPETGVMVLKMIYRAGFTNPWHSHPRARGIYVLGGTLNTPFITNKAFAIHFVGDENDLEAPVGGRPAGT